MKISFLLPQTDVEGKLTAVDVDGNPVRLRSFTWEPVFHHADSVPAILYAEVRTDKDRCLSKSVLTVSGRRGKLTLLDRTRPVTPACERDDPGASKRQREAADKASGPRGGDDAASADSAAR